MDMKTVCAVAYMVCVFGAYTDRHGAAAQTKVQSHHGVATDPKGFDAKYQKVVGEGPLTAEQMANMGLTPKKLRYPWRGHNFHRNVEGGSWLLETLPVGTLVAVDARGDQVYKVDCANRLVWDGDIPAPASKPKPKPTPTLGPSVGRRFWNWLWTPWWPAWWPYGHVTIDVAGPDGPYTIDSYGSHRVVVAPHGDGRATFVVYP